MNDRCGCVRAHGYDLTGKMTGGGLRSVAWASAITLVESSVIALPRLLVPSYPPMCNNGGVRTAPRSPACNEHAGLHYFTPNPAPDRLGERGCSR